MARTRRTVTGGSPTFANLAPGPEFGAGCRRSPVSSDDMRQGGFGGGAAGMLQRAATAASTGFTQSGREATNAEIAKILFARSQGDMTPEHGGFAPACFNAAAGGKTIVRAGVALWWRVRSDKPLTGHQLVDGIGKIGIVSAHDVRVNRKGNVHVGMPKSLRHRFDWHLEA